MHSLRSSKKKEKRDAVLHISAQLLHKEVFALTREKIEATDLVATVIQVAVPTRRWQRLPHNIRAHFCDVGSEFHHASRAATKSSWSRSKESAFAVVMSFRSSRFAVLTIIARFCRLAFGSGPPRSSPMRRALVTKLTHCGLLPPHRCVEACNVIESASNSTGCIPNLSATTPANAANGSDSPKEPINRSFSAAFQDCFWGACTDAGCHVKTPTPGVATFMSPSLSIMTSRPTLPQHWFIRSFHPPWPTWSFFASSTASMIRTSSPIVSTIPAPPSGPSNGRSPASGTTETTILGFQHQHPIAP
mmetsp:Transcript_53709/g.143655  ORF Transcript_53709/g.143655 Transcript_53709/m.143655 type:complete len:304 (+) Transcript_53709:349-1260(+)